MTTIFYHEHLRYKINENDHNPPHVHVEGMGASIRVNLLTLEIMDSKTEFSLTTIRHITEYIKANRIVLLQEWEDRHG